MTKAEQKVEQEIEASLCLPKNKRDGWFDFAVQKFQQPTVFFLKNSYFDTPEHVLISHGMGLRIRESSNHIEQTLKLVGTCVDGVHIRTEYHVNLRTPQVDLQAFASEIWPNDIDIHHIQPRLSILFETNFKRYTWHVNYRQSTIEIVLDEGNIFAGNQQQEILEIELELKQGRLEDLLSLKESMQKEFHLEPLLLSKAHRGFQLLG